MYASYFSICPKYYIIGACLIVFTSFSHLVLKTTMFTKATKHCHPAPIDTPEMKSPMIKTHKLHCWFCSEQIYLKRTWSSRSVGCVYLITPAGYYWGIWWQLEDTLVLQSPWRVESNQNKRCLHGFTCATCAYCNFCSMVHT